MEDIRRSPPRHWATIDGAPSAWPRPALPWRMENDFQADAGANSVIPFSWL